LDGKAQTIVIAPTLANNIQIGIIKVKDRTLIYSFERSKSRL
jgi:hypothetical protein